MSSETRYSQTTTCRHCGNDTPMVVGATFSQVQQLENTPGGFTWEEGPVFEIWACPACRGVSLAKYYWHDAHDPDDMRTDVVYPNDADAIPLGLPHQLHKEFVAAARVRMISPNAYGVLLGRLLELVCNERGATEGKLGMRLKQLADNEEIPQKLVKVGEKLQELRHVGAHAFVGELGPAEVPILDSLCRAILEYVYTAPQLVAQAEMRLAQLRKQQKERKVRVATAAKTPTASKVSQSAATSKKDARPGNASRRKGPKKNTGGDA
ncbi:MAG: DUF4145 domain-containing protein [Betaproteobacteria bacterium]|nr:DUF4145 domain-containing protein [Betaproteobacteria bacterium]